MTRHLRGGAARGSVGSVGALGAEASAPRRGDEAAGRAQLRRRLGRADLRAVSEVRGALRELLRHWGRPGRAETAELLTSELVTNALVHTDREAILTATLGPRRLRVEVRDFVGRCPRPRVPENAEDTHGRGLLLVQSLADTWGVRVHGVGKVVWFELDAEPG
ncbi:ATP-binding protein [Streptomyces flavofungini]|uniref:ATP-binding protein n=1 Tax=Streptomyces flavofungini TaxID=68200 RepID=A0ABS0X8V6_9ACTN|nr:ATP-binding protein [Streptomyces flavofungini]MBJ3809639.1 ATP-binding protein [Streptomyces flavofungini]